MERSLFGALLIIAAGIALRFGRPGPRRCSLALARFGAGIAVANVLLPSLLKRDFPEPHRQPDRRLRDHVGIGPGARIRRGDPCELPGSSWQLSAASTLVFPLAALMVWIPPSFARPRRPAGGELASRTHGGPIWHSGAGLAGDGLLLGLGTSLVFYIIVGWLQDSRAEQVIRQRQWLSSLHGVSQLATAVPGLILGPMASRG